MRLRLDIAYDGTDFAGWATQPHLRTVQQTIENALAKVFRLDHAPRLVVAGRTDAGVHATGQVAHVDLEGVSDTTDFERVTDRVASALRRDADVVIRHISPAPDGFDARFSPVARRYEYRIADSLATQNPLERRRTVWLTTPLSLVPLNAAASTLIGLHDFGAFCKPREGSTTIRDLQEFSWSRDDEGTLVATLQADAFCHSMVRALVGACVAVGTAKLTTAELAGIRDVAARTSAFKVMPAHGLTLVEVVYPADADLASRAEQTRAKRE